MISLSIGLINQTWIKNNKAKNVFFDSLFQGRSVKVVAKRGKFQKAVCLHYIDALHCFYSSDDANFSEVSQQLSLQWEPLKLTKYWKKTSTAKKRYNFEIESSAQHLQLSLVNLRESFNLSHFVRKCLTIFSIYETE